MSQEIDNYGLEVVGIDGEFLAGDVVVLPECVQSHLDLESAAFVNVLQLAHGRLNLLQLTQLVQNVRVGNSLLVLLFLTQMVEVSEFQQIKLLGGGGLT